MTGRRRVEKQVVQYLPIFNDMNHVQQQARLTMVIEAGKGYSDLYTDTCLYGLNNN